MRVRVYVCARARWRFRNTDTDHTDFSRGSPDESKVKRGVLLLFSQGSTYDQLSFTKPFHVRSQTSAIVRMSVRCAISCARAHTIV